MHTRVYLDIGLSLSIQRVIVTSPSFARAAITFFFSSEFSRPSGSIIRTEDLKILEFWNFRVSKAGVVSIFDFNSSERISLRVSLIEVKTMVEDSITKAKIR